MNSETKKKLTEAQAIIRDILDNEPTVLNTINELRASRMKETNCHPTIVLMRPRHLELFELERGIVPGSGLVRILDLEVVLIYAGDIRVF